MSNQKLKGSMIGGGFDYFIGPMHRMAMIIDGEAEIVGGVFSSDPERSAKFGESLYMDPARVHGSIEELIAAELALPEMERIDFITVCTPNIAHYAVVCTALDAGFHVVCDKLVTLTLEESYNLENRIAKSV
jgi:predicted dehydrogenase